MATRHGDERLKRMNLRTWLVWRMPTRRGFLYSLAVFCAATQFGSRTEALPSFARQTGFACARCHTVAFGPALTAYGRQFKLNGYVWGDAQESIPRIALMVEGGFTHTAKDQSAPPANLVSTNDNLSVDQVSLFYGGRITQHVGAFVQVTYNGEQRHTTWDNLEVRFARATTIGNTGVVFGVSVNNN